MAAKPASLANAFDDVTPPPAAPVLRAVEQPPKAAPIPSREGTALLGAHLPARYGKAMRRLSVDVEKTQRDLIEEALQMLFVRYGVKL
jgi:hypothetical protein